MGIEHVIDSFLSDARLKVKSVRQLMLPLTISSWIVGMGIIEFPLGEPWPYASVVYAIVLITLYGIVVGVALINVDLLIITKTRMGKTIFQALFYGNICLNIFGTLLAWMRIKNMKIIVDRLEAFDAKMKKMGIPRDYRIICIRELMSLFIQFFIIIFMLVIIKPSPAVEITIWIRMASVAAIYYPLLIISVGDLSFITLVRFMNMRFDQLNKYLLSMSTCTENSPQHKRVLEYTRSKSYDSVDIVHEKRTNDDHSAIKAAREYHHELVKISSMINDTFGVQALFSMTVSFGLITGLLYDTCNILWSEPSQEVIENETEHVVCWLGFHILRIVLINSACAKTSAAAKKTGFIICHLHEPSTKKAFRDEIRDFTLQLTQYSLTFTACGFFTLNYELIQGMIGSITTYLVILIQIGEIPPTEVLVNMTIGSF